MKKVFVFALALLVFFKPAFSFAATDYLVKNFHSKITLNQDASLTVQERIEVEFLEQKHGIFRVIPVVYSAGGRTIKADLKILSITDENQLAIPYKTSRYNQSIKIRIGDPDKTIIGNQTYILTYRIGRVVQRFEDYDEIYWNVTGSEWTSQIGSASAQLESEFAKIIKTDCFSGRAGSREKFCQAEFTDNQAEFKAGQPIVYGKDFTIVVGLDKNNQLGFPGILQRVIWGITDNWGYLAAIMPFLLMSLAWYKKGRDKRYLSDNVYYKLEEGKQKTVSAFSRPHLPMVYHPIDNLTPAQVGVIIDEKADVQDIVAEIVELARLGYLKIKKEKKRKYKFEKINKNTKKLEEYQRLLLDGLFAQGNQVSLSELKNKFYKYLTKIKKELYQSLVKKGAFPVSPEKVKLLWFGLAMGLSVLSFIALIVFIGITSNLGPMAFFIPSVIGALIWPKFMPRKTAWGYSLHRQTKGLKWYLGKGKWREEIAEKHLFLEEMLPLAIALGVVNKLAKDMAKLGVEPPRYFEGVAIATLSRDLNSFQAVAATGLVSSPSGKSSWSGGSGFGGGSSGGGFGGGGGGSW